jgi:hypothetical protein
MDVVTEDGEVVGEIMLNPDTDCQVLAPALRGRFSR